MKKIYITPELLRLDMQTSTLLLGSIEHGGNDNGTGTTDAKEASYEFDDSPTFWEVNK